MLYEMLVLFQYLPKITLFYAAFSFLNGMSISNLILGTTLFFDVLDYVPID